jgi:hypothetical protein
MDPLLAKLFPSPDEAQAVFDDPEHPDWEMAYAYLCEHPETANVMRTLVERTRPDVFSDDGPCSTDLDVDADLSDLEEKIDDVLRNR